MVFISDIESNKYLIGICMIIVNIGSRYIIEELTEEQKKYINNKLFRRIIIFSIFYISTKDIITSLTLTVIFVLFISELFNDEKIKDKGNYTMQLELQVNDIKNDLNSIQQKINLLNLSKEYDCIYYSEHL